MRTLYIECNMGAAGDMIMAALLELIDSKEAFLKQMNGLGLKGVKLSANRSVKHGVNGTAVSVTVDGREEVSIDVDMEKDQGYGFDETFGEEHSHHHSHRHSSLADIEAVILGLPVSQWVKDNALAVYGLIAEAESRIHKGPVSEIHFDELGGMDAVADIVGVCLLMERLSPDRVVVSPVHVGSGLVRCFHGILPVPAPATAYILQGVPTYGGMIKGELCTPTGAALLKHFAGNFGPLPEMRIHKIGYGMGKKDFAVVNCVRAFLGEGNAAGGANDTVAELRCNIDDMSGEALGFVCRKLIQEGAFDAFTTAVGMKKDRPGTMLTCICGVERADEFAAMLLQHTTTFGVRKDTLSRYTLEREVRLVTTPFGQLRIKVGKGYNVERAKFEYEDVAALADEQGVPIDEMIRRLWKYVGEGGHDR
ncbi:MAG: nickel pincer cofactor biosynthesis protein LarC [Methanomassiliicoccaceae archaeon]|nr:nickel pincer cofactor biosynthesis protein LarC [Methanomassiliicoccaceae archaeon]